MIFKYVTIFLFILITLFLLSLVAGFPKPPYTYTISKSQFGRAEVYSLELLSIVIDLVCSMILALILTLFWSRSKRTSPGKLDQH
jgi:hypothetical protein